MGVERLDLTRATTRSMYLLQRVEAETDTIESASDEVVSAGLGHSSNKHIQISFKTSQVGSFTER